MGRVPIHWGLAPWGGAIDLVTLHEATHFHFALYPHVVSLALLVDAPPKKKKNAIEELQGEEAREDRVKMVEDSFSKDWDLHQKSQS